ncbi:hypothetical protein PHLCEN_2v2359 [Hermanssonia centrifuga]|uniref:Uncharacterized protein n=1 Tax=Hermanssonia centrifuga TaxID=98765 RepID=A0A2R6RM38_9APHY|nr:hypothetical protein PHLCEN_2v2359 [Hermanssonia centrifuga]
MRYQDRRQGGTGINLEGLTFNVAATAMNWTWDTVVTKGAKPSQLRLSGPPGPAHHYSLRSTGAVPGICKVRALASTSCGRTSDLATKLRSA